MYTRFQTEKAQNPTRRGRKYLYGLYKGVPPRVYTVYPSRIFVFVQKQIATDNSHGKSQLR